jgi:hypothetical protein
MGRTLPQGQSSGSTVFALFTPGLVEVGRKIDLL